MKALAVIAWSMPSTTVVTTVTPLANRPNAPRNAMSSTGGRSVLLGWFTASA